MKKLKLPRNAIKECFDNLPSGICYFNKNEIPILCNLQMHRLMFALLGRDIWQMKELTTALDTLPKESKVKKVGNYYILEDGTVWQFTSSIVKADSTYTEYVATNVTELFSEKQELEKQTKKHEEMVKNLKEISKNITAITREEEILTLKMQVHNKVGLCLQKLRKYHTNGYKTQEKQEIITELQNVAKSLMGEIGNNDEIDTFAELLRLADSVGVKVSWQGEIPTNVKQKDILDKALRECITNTLRHANGNEVYAEITNQNDFTKIKITNNGNPPKGKITEGGGLTSLRKKIEKIGGQMEIEISPQFALIIILQ